MSAGSFASQPAVPLCNLKYSALYPSAFPSTTLVSRSEPNAGLCDRWQSVSPWEVREPEKEEGKTPV